MKITTFKRLILAGLYMVPALGTNAAIMVGCGDDTGSSNGDTIDGDTDDSSSDSNFVTIDGLGTPESALHDSAADVYLVSNINGSAGAEDDNGFISRIDPKGEMIEEKWIDGAHGDVVLNAPKGMGLFEETLYIADLTRVRRFDRTTGAPKGEIEIQGASFLNDIAVNAEGLVYVSDSSGDAIYEIDEDGSYRLFADGETLSGPNGLAIDGDTLWVTSGFDILHLGQNGEVEEAMTAPSDGLDGLVLLADGRLIVSSWNGNAVYISDAGSSFDTLFSNLSGAADIGFDAERSRVLIPMFNDDRLLIRPLDL